MLFIDHVARLILLKIVSFATRAPSSGDGSFPGDGPSLGRAVQSQSELLG
jgi:hypothetical protein